MEEVYPRNDVKPKQPVCIEYKIPRQPVKLSEDLCNILMLSLSRWDGQNSFELSENDLFNQKWYQSRLNYKTQDAR